MKLNSNNNPNLNPTGWGCWFCDGTTNLSFEAEFDTYVHKQCVRAALDKDKNHPEATLMQYLLEED